MAGERLAAYVRAERSRTELPPAGADSRMPTGSEDTFTSGSMSVPDSNVSRPGCAVPYVARKIALCSRRQSTSSG